MNKKIIEQINQLSMDLKLPAFRKDIQAVNFGQGIPL